MKALGLIIFVLGIIAGMYFASAEGTEWEETPDSMLLSLHGVESQPSPKDRVQERQIAVYGDRVVLDLQGAQWARFTDTKSMEPVLYAGANAIELPPKSEDDLQVGDICSYKARDGDIIHRIVHKGVDEDGTYFIFKGDNIPTSDPGRIRFDQIQRCVIAIVY